MFRDNLKQFRYLGNKLITKLKIKIKHCNNVWYLRYNVLMKKKVHIEICSFSIV